MPTITLHQTELGNDRYRVNLSSEKPELTLQHQVEFDFRLDPQDQEAIRWYLEEYLDKPFDPNPEIASRTEQRMADLGGELFETIFNDRKAIGWWTRVVDDLADYRIEVATSVAGATAIPWELLRDPDSDITLALRAAEFVRSHRQAKIQPRIPEPAEQLRILLVICRPNEGQDVPFRSVASQLVRGLSEAAREQVSLTVLRPPTFARLSQVLADAKAQGEPFHVLHFDGHGLYADSDQLKASLPPADALRFQTERKGSHGYLLFENPQSESNSDYIDGPRLAKLMVRNQVPALILNACRSAHADAPLESSSRTGSPENSTPEGEQAYSSRAVLQADQFAQSGHARAFGSLAQEVMDAGVAGVVAMRYNLWVVTATQFVFELYRNLARGLGLGAAVSQGRRQLHAEPQRRIAYRSLPLQDWPVPVVFEAAPIQLLPPNQSKQTDWQLDLGQGPAPKDNLPPPPDIGFIGRDETLLALDRAFDGHKVVLLLAYAGSGKTVTAVEFARWYVQTDGLQGGPVLFTSFESLKPLYQVLGDFGETFAPLLEHQGIQWGALNELEERRNIALQVMAQVPMLWIWDNIEPITGFPEGTDSTWSTEEQQELRAFLQAANQTKARILLTSRRDERPWLGDLPRRIPVPPMPMTERAAFAEALAAKQHQPLALADWRPLLRFSEGNPLTLLVVVRQALAEGLSDGAAIDAFVQRLRSGEAGFADEAAQGRDRSLAASLDYGFARAFGEPEQAILALLVFFQGFVYVDVLRVMGDPDQEWPLPALRGQGRDRLIPLLDRAARLGLLDNLGGGNYRIHPALPWFFRRLFQRHYPEIVKHGRPDAESATRAFCAAMRELGNYYHRQYNEGQRNVISYLRAEEANLRHAWRLARQLGFWESVIGPMQGLDTLYDHTGRRAEWAALLTAVTPELVGPDDGPLPGREGQWSQVTQYRVRLAREERDWAMAERMQRRWIEWERQQAAPLLERSVVGLSGAERNRLGNLGASLHELGQVQRNLEQPDCVRSYQDALEVAQKIGENDKAAICAFNLGHVYWGIRGEGVPALRDLAQAEHWYRRSMELFHKEDKRGKATCLGQLGAVAWERFQEALAAEQPSVAEAQVEAALKHYHKALALLPADEVNDLAVTYNALGLYTEPSANWSPPCATGRSASALMRRVATTTARPRPASTSPSHCSRPGATPTPSPMPAPPCVASSTTASERSRRSPKPRRSSTASNRPAMEYSARAVRIAPQSRTGRDLYSKGYAAFGVQLWSCTNAGWLHVETCAPG